MRLLLACEFYYPSRGGVQEVMRQIAERLAAAGHDVTVCTTALEERTFTSHAGVKIEEFRISGNRVHGLVGETQRYVDFLKSFDCDAMLIKAAQQWTFDAAWPALDSITARKVFIPCGFSGLYEPAYKGYFEELPAIMAKFDRLIFYAESYRDIDFARAHGLTNCDLLPNGASDTEFAEPVDTGIRARLDIPQDALLVMTVGTPINAKGHTELAEAFTRLDPKGRTLALLLNGRWPEPPKPAPDETHPPADPGEDVAPTYVIPNSFPSATSSGGVLGIARRARDIAAREGLAPFVRRTAEWTFYRTGWVLRGAARPFAAAAGALRARVARLQHHDAVAAEVAPAILTIDDHIATIEGQDRKIVRKTNLSRSDLIEAFFAADLFVFASNVEYSPLVLFEAGAAGLPYLTVPVGNAEEIVRWTGGGEICRAAKDERGYTRVDPAVLAEHVQNLLDDAARRQKLGEAGREAWRQTFNWAAIVPRYEAILRGEPARAGSARTEGSQAVVRMDF